MDLKLKQLEAFIWVSELGSFRKAADRLSTTQPNISSRLAALENILGLKLMDRDAGSVRLTSDGQRLLKQAHKVIRSAEEFVEASDNRELHNNTIRLGVTEIIAHTWLRDFLVALKALYPNVLVEPVIDYSVNLKRELHTNMIDLVLQNGPFSRRMSGSRELGFYPFIWVASPSLAIAQNNDLQVKDLQAHPLLTPARNTGIYDSIIHHFSGIKKASIRMTPSSTLASSLHMTLDGLGIALMPEIMVADAIASGKLQKVNYSWVPEPLEFRARYIEETSSLIICKAAELAEKIAKDYLKAQNRSARR